MTGKARKSAGRAPEPQQPAIDAFRSQHFALAERQIATEHGRASVTGKPDAIGACARPLSCAPRNRNGGPTGQASMKAKVRSLGLRGGVAATAAP